MNSRIRVLYSLGIWAVLSGGSLCAETSATASMDSADRTAFRLAQALAFPRVVEVNARKLATASLADKNGSSRAKAAQAIDAIEAPDNDLLLGAAAFDLQREYTPAELAELLAYAESSEYKKLRVVQEKLEKGAEKQTELLAAWMEKQAQKHVAPPMVTPLPRSSSTVKRTSTRSSGPKYMTETTRDANGNIIGQKRVAVDSDTYRSGGRTEQVTTSSSLEQQPKQFDPGNDASLGPRGILNGAAILEQLF